MPIGNTRKTYDVSANGTNIRHHVDTDLFDRTTRRLSGAVSSPSPGLGTDLADTTGSLSSDAWSFSVLLEFAWFVSSCFTWLGAWLQGKCSKNGNSFRCGKL